MALHKERISNLAFPGGKFNMVQQGFEYEGVVLNLVSAWMRSEDWQGNWSVLTFQGIWIQVCTLACGSDDEKGAALRRLLRSAEANELEVQYPSSKNLRPIMQHVCWNFDSPAKQYAVGHFRHELSFAPGCYFSGLHADQTWFLALSISNQNTKNPTALA